MAELDVLNYVTHERSYFDTIAPWNGMRRVALDTNKQVVGIHHPDDTDKWADGTTVDWTTYESNGWNCMVEIPKFYYKSELGTVGAKKTFRWYISDTLKSGLKVHPAFVRAGVEQNYQYMSAFEGSLIGTKLRSLPNKDVTHTRTIVQFRTDCQANGAGFEQQDFMLTSAIQLLMSIELGGFNSQGLLDYGNLSTGAYMIMDTMITQEAELLTLEVITRLP